MNPSLVVFIKYGAVAVCVIAVFVYILCFITAYFRVYLVLDSYLNERQLKINKELEKKIVRELNIKFPYHKYLTINIDAIHEIESDILNSIIHNYEEEITKESL